MSSRTKCPWANTSVSLADFLVEFLIPKPDVTAMGSKSRWTISFDFASLHQWYPLSFQSCFGAKRLDGTWARLLSICLVRWDNEAWEVHVISQILTQCQRPHCTNWDLQKAETGPPVKVLQTISLDIPFHLFLFFDKSFPFSAVSISDDREPSNGTHEISRSIRPWLHVLVIRDSYDTVVPALLSNLAATKWYALRRNLIKLYRNKNQLVIFFIW